MIKKYPIFVVVFVFVLSLFIVKSDGQSSNNIIVISKLEPPFLMREDPNSYHGYIKDLAEILFRKLGKSYIFRVIDGISYEDMITDLTDRRGHAILAPLTVTKHRAELIDFSMPFMEAKLAILQKKPLEDDEDLEMQGNEDEEMDFEDEDVFSEHPWFEPFSIWLWLVFVLSSIVLLFVIFFVEKIVGGKKVERNRKEKLFQGFSTKVFGTPRSYATRFLQITFWIFLIVIFSVYVGNFAADRIVNLINDSYKTVALPINSPEQLLKLSDKVKFGFLNDSSTSRYFRESENSTIQQLNKKVAEAGTVITSYEEGIDRVRRANGTFVFIMESPAAKYITTLEPCDLGIGETLFGIKRGFSMAIRKPQDFIYQDKLLDMREINVKLLEMKEDGILDDLETKWFKDISECEEERKINIKVDPDVYEPLCFETMGGFLILLGLSVFVVLIIAVIEVILISKA